MSKTNIREIIKQKGLSVQEAAKMCGIPAPTVSAHYYGQRVSMTLSVAAKYSAGLGVSIDEIIKGETDEQ